MLTIFTNPRPFRGQFDFIQRNAIQSWLKLKPECEIILFEDEEGTTSRVAKEFGIRCETNIKRDEFGTPLFNDVFEKVQKISNNEIIIQVNADIILLSDFTKGVSRIKNLIGSRPFFVTGRRWNLNVEGPIDFSDLEWELKLRSLVKREGKLYGFSGMDYWVFPRNFSFEPPAFIVGRPGIDSWLIYKARSLKIPVIDATEVIDIIHQNHNYPRKKSSFFEIEKKRNIKLALGHSHFCTLRDADWILTLKGLKKPEFPRRIFAQLTLFYLWRQLLSIKRKLQNIR